MTALEVAKWQQRYRVDRDATDGRHGEAQRTGWENVIARENKSTSQSGSPGLGLGEGLRAGQSPCGVGLGDALQLPEEDIAGVMWVLRAPEECSLKDGRSRTRPSRQSCQDQSEVACFYVLCCRMH